MTTTVTPAETLQDAGTSWLQAVLWPMLSSSVSQVAELVVERGLHDDAQGCQPSTVLHKDSVVSGTGLRDLQRH